ncbi:unnamed protein product [Macrosiphum euphorbiae]|uniref:Reverse transcriptase domain-containing protein n=1 Tax=Macrosiphum euphorbiae TaxID=13131 RepID=A0AAV0XP91_9HEMI|nr:unnamed protein product [Macrosiphum euphorbiae]
MEFNRPVRIKLTGNINDNFKTFKQEIEVYFMATETYKKPKEVQVARLLNLLGPDGLKLFNTFKIEDKSIETIFKCLEEYCVPKKNVVMEHYKYFTRKQNENESFDKFYADLRELIKSCEFGEAEETLLCSQIVLGIHDKDLQTKLLREHLPLPKIIKYCQAVEQAEMHRRVVQKESPALDQIEERQQFKSKGWSQIKQNNKSQRKQEHKNKNQVNYKNKNSGESQNNNVKKFSCNRCGISHGINECPAYGKTCNNCFKLNHFAVKCRKGANKGELHEVQCNNSNDEEEELTYLSLNSIESEKQINWTDIVVIDSKKELKIKLDTEAQLNVMPLKEFKKLNKNLEKSSVVIKSFGGFKIESLEKVKVNLKNSKNEISTYFEVVNYNDLLILGLKDCIKLNYEIKEVNEINSCKTEKDVFLQKYNDIFNGLGKFPEKISIKVKDDANPKIFPPRRVPYKIVNKLKETLDKMCELKIIEKCKEPSEWQSPIIIIKKPDKSLRVCLDPRELNKNIVREMYQIPTLEEIKLNLLNKKYFTLLDLRDGFYQCELDQKSQNYCCFSTPLVGIST